MDGYAMDVRLGVGANGVTTSQRRRCRPLSNRTGAADDFAGYGNGKILALRGRGGVAALGSHSSRGAGAEAENLDPGTLEARYRSPPITTAEIAQVAGWAAEIEALLSSINMIVIPDCLDENFGILNGIFFIAAEYSFFRIEDAGTTDNTEIVRAV